MNPLQQLQAWFGPNAKAIRSMAAPLVVVMILAMMVLPLPAFALDLLFTFNIAMALMVMMVAAYMIKPLDFAAFPSVILLTTLLRLSLNVASTRVVLMQGHTGAAAAGQVIESFGHFLIGGNFAVGLIVFAILVVINFIVVTKGAERIAEVGARFTLDAMPGKQMAIDADLNAGLIDEKEAKKRRAEVGDEAEFFGSMDGASKYVRGDAMAGLLILFINIIGGFIIGVAQHDLSAADAANSYILLAVGDALVAQIPALLISVPAAMGVSRVGKENDVVSPIAKQVFNSPRRRGFPPPAVPIRDNLEPKASMYRLTLRGAVVGEGEAFPGMWLAINPGGATTNLIGTATKDPAFGLPAVWIEERQREAAQMSGFTVVDCSTVVATHLSHLMQLHAAKLLGRVETQQLVEHVTKLAPQLIEDVVPKMVGIAALQKVLQLLLEEGVHIRDMRSIVESLAETAATVTDPAELSRRIRIHLAPSIVQQIYGPVKELEVIALEPELERLVTQALNSPHGAALEPGVADTLARSAADSAKRQEDMGHPACLLVPDLIRAPMARLLKRAAPRLRVLAHSEIPETHSIRIGSILRG